MVEQFRSAASVVAALPFLVEEYRSLSEQDLLAVHDDDSAIVRSAQARQALIAGEIARRSRHEFGGDGLGGDGLGGDGLVQRAGHRAVEGFLKPTAMPTKSRALKDLWRAALAS
jgi:hypothetical protein